MRLLTFVILFIPLAARAQESSPESLMAAWEKSWNTYNLDEVSRLFVNDGSVTYFSSERAGLIQGIDSLIKHHRGFGFVPGGKSSPSTGSGQRPNKLWLADVRYRSLSVTATWYFKRPDGTQQSGPVTFILQKSGNAFRIAHAHFSNDPKGR